MLSGGIVLEEALDLSSDRLLMNMLSTDSVNYQKSKPNRYCIIYKILAQIAQTQTVGFKTVIQNLSLNK
jgi:hypothetical protein